MGSIPSSWMASMCCRFARSAKMPAWTAGCRVFTRPSMISGKSVVSETRVIGMPTSWRCRAVPPVDIISTPISTKPLAKGSRFHLLDTETRALLTFTFPPLGDLAGFAIVHPHQASTCHRRFHVPSGNQLDRPRKESVLHPVDAACQALFRIVLLYHHYLLQNHRPRIHSSIHKVNGDPGQLDSIAHCIRDRRIAGEGGEKRGVLIDDPVRETSKKLLGEEMHVACQNNQIRPHVLNLRRHRPIARLPRRVLVRREHSSGDIRAGRALKSQSLRIVTGYHHYLNPTDAPV